MNRLSQPSQIITNECQKPYQQQQSHLRVASVSTEVFFMFFGPKKLACLVSSLILIKIADQSVRQHQDNTEGSMVISLFASTWGYYCILSYSSSSMAVSSSTNQLISHPELSTLLQELQTEELKKSSEKRVFFEDAGPEPRQKNASSSYSKKQKQKSPKESKRSVKKKDEVNEPMVSGNRKAERNANRVCCVFKI